MSFQIFLGRSVQKFAQVRNGSWEKKLPFEGFNLQPIR